ncbi:AraC family transcriptional regulator [Actinoplanes sp. L3-i22]|uniref:helix-turn-helix domain-containing protein n=1 Tax=Actinoplanes sp. L3-i22 TaxID=2836373 RepID=UPI001C79762D|nr:AraC family transcriptional regulator [Actinoplanes sp. L3-i22]BCY08937.1 transcriptional regulator [Actinoplanes sp. L3-i22]
MTTIRQVTYRPRSAADVAVEVLSFSTLRARYDGRPQRADFHVLAFVRRGQGEVSMDFASYALGPRSVAWIRPGVVHRWTDIERLAGELVLFVPTAPVTPTSQALVADLGAAGCWPVEAPAWRHLMAALGHLRLESGQAAVRELPALLLSALVLRLDPPAAGPQAVDETFRRFRAAVEQDFRSRHDVGHYARTLGWSARTLSRSCRAATGRTAKEFVAERLVLEAKRLLVHDGLSPARCGERLGFPDPSNFSAFFLHGTGHRPGAWQTANR